MFPNDTFVQVIRSTYLGLDSPRFSKQYSTWPLVIIGISHPAFCILQYNTAHFQLSHVAGDTYAGKPIVIYQCRINASWIMYV